MLPVPDVSSEVIPMGECVSREAVNVVTSAVTRVVTARRKSSATKGTPAARSRRRPGTGANAKVDGKIKDWRLKGHKSF
jgi:hypothetical protein